jgi:hypothetical protein
LLFLTWWFLFVCLFLPFLSFCIIDFTITIFFSVFLPPSLSLLLLHYNPLFSLPTILSTPSHPLSTPVLNSPFSSSNLSSHYPSLLHTHNLLTTLLCQLYTFTVPCIPWHKHPHYNNRNTPTYTRAT